jgi:hypothetical protein
MIINNKEFSEGQIRSFLYFKDDSALRIIQVFLKRTLNLVTLCTWINSSKVLEAIKSDPKAVIRVFENVDCSRNRRIEEIRKEFLISEDLREKRELIRNLAKPLYEYRVLGAPAAPLLDSLSDDSLIKAQSLSSIKQIIEQLNTDLEKFKKEEAQVRMDVIKKHAKPLDAYKGLSVEFVDLVDKTLSNEQRDKLIGVPVEIIENKIKVLNSRVERVQRLNEMGIKVHVSSTEFECQAAANEFFKTLKSDVYYELSKEEQASLNLTDEEKTFLDHVILNRENRLDNWLKYSKNPTNLKNIDKSVREKIDQAFNLAQKLPVWKALVLKYVDLDTMPDAHYGPPIRALFNNRVNSIESARMFNRDNLEDYIRSFAVENKCGHYPDVSDEIINSKLEFIRKYPLTDEYKTLFDVRVFPKDNYFFNQIYLFYWQQKIDQPLSKYDRYLLSELDENQYKSKFEGCKKFFKALKVLRALNYRFHPREIVEAINHSVSYEQTLKTILADYSYFNMTHFIQSTCKYSKPALKNLTNDQQLLLDRMYELRDVAENNALNFEIIKDWLEKAERPERLEETLFTVVFTAKYCLDVDYYNGFKRFINENVDFRILYNTRLNGPYSSSDMMKSFISDFDRLYPPREGEMRNNVLSEARLNPNLVGEVWKFISQYCRKH